jgi:general secretion pathway protein D
MQYQTAVSQAGLLRSIVTVVAAFVLMSCAVGPVERADDYITQDEWMKAVLEYREALAKNPTDVEFKSRLKQTELKAADHYYQRGMSMLEQANLDAAILQFQQGLAAMPDHAKLLQAMNQTLLRKEAESLVAEAQHELEAGKQDEGRRRLKRALDLYPDMKSATELLARLDKQATDEEADAERLNITSRAPITLTFRQTDLRTAFEFVAKSFGIDVIFDESIKSTPVTLFAKDATFEQALNLILVTTKTFYKKVGPSTILIAPDSKEKRGQYEDQLVRTFQLSSIRAKDMADVLKGLVSVKKLIVNESLNTLLVRDTEETLKVISKIIEANDRRAAELILEVEILEVNRTKAERLGLDFGSYQIGASIPSATAIPYTGNLGGAFRSNATLTLPSVLFNFYKQDVDAKTLANPRVRVLSGKAAKIHIGDRVPLRASTIQDATGQVRTTYDYKDIGIRLNAEPVIHLDNSVTVKVGLEVSSLGANLGTQAEPAFSIGTRNAETFMTLRDGETAILGGLIRDEDRKSRVSVPLLGDIPVVGGIFTSHDSNNQRTDVLLTITPRVVRGWDMPGKERMFVSGSEERYTSQPLFANFAAPIAPVAKAASESKRVEKSPVIAPSTKPDVAAVKPLTETKAIPTAVQPATSGQGTLLAFAEAIYDSTTGQEFEIKLTAENLNGVSQLPLEILYNPQLVKYVRNAPGSFPTKEFKVEADEGRGVIRVTLAYPAEATPQGTGVLARLILRGERPGISYLVYRAPALTNAAGEAVTVQVRASRVVLK